MCSISPAERSWTCAPHYAVQGDRRLDELRPLWQVQYEAQRSHRCISENITARDKARHLLGLPGAQWVLAVS